MLRGWIEDLERDGNGHVGAKHPLLTLCGPDLVEAWGANTRFIWTWRPLEESTASLQRRGWWPGNEEEIQARLWRAAQDFFSKQDHLRVEFAEMLGDPRREMNRLIEFLELEPTGTQRAAAVAAIHCDKTSHAGEWK
jgi:hypothetical protein